jgi:hypothetical protein
MKTMVGSNWRARIIYQKNHQSQTPFDNFFNDVISSKKVAVRLADDPVEGEELGDDSGSEE